MRCSMRIRFADTAQHADTFFVIHAISNAKADNEFARPISASLRLWTTELLLKKCRCNDEPLVTLCPIQPAQDLNLRLPPSETNV